MYRTKTGCGKDHGGNFDCNSPTDYCTAGVQNLQSTSQMQLAWTFHLARIRIFVTRVRVQHRIKMKLHDKQVLR